MKPGGGSLAKHLFTHLAVDGGAGQPAACVTLLDVVVVGAGAFVVVVVVVFVVIVVVVFVVVAAVEAVVVAVG